MSWFFHVLVSSAFSQSESLTEILNDLETDDYDFNEWVEYIQNNPVDINNATEDDLKEIPFFTKILVDSILSNRPFQRKTQLRKILGDQLYRLINSFIVIKKIQYYPQISATQRFQYTLNKNRAFTNRLYQGSAYESFSRIRINLNYGISAGVLIQKDPGELLHHDHYAAYISWKQSKIPLWIIAGNYQIHCAEGLLLSGPYTIPKSALIKSPLMHRMFSLKSFISSNENDGFWGIAVNWGTDSGLKIASFYSNIYRDAVLNETLTEAVRLDRSGYHRKFSEISNQNTIREKSWGALLQSPFFFSSQIGFSYIRTSYSLPFINRPSEERKRDFYRFQGNTIENYSFFYSAQLGKLLLHGEVKPKRFRNMAQKHTADLNMKTWGFTFRWSYLPSEFQSPFGRSFLVSTPFPNSIQEYYFGLWGKLATGLKLSGFWSLEKQLWRSFFHPLPQFYKSLFLQSEYDLKRIIHIKFRYQYSSVISDPIDNVINNQRSSHRFRLQIDKDISTQVLISSRVESNFVNPSGPFSQKKGSNFYQNISIAISNSISLHGQFSSFYTADYETRVYEYERDIPGVFSNYPLYGSGNKWYMLLRFRLYNSIKIWLKYRQINFEGVDHIGSGLSMIEGNTRQDIHFQIEFRF